MKKSKQFITYISFDVKVFQCFIFIFLFWFFFSFFILEDFIVIFPTLKMVPLLSVQLPTPSYFRGALICLYVQFNVKCAMIIL